MKTLEESLTEGKQNHSEPNVPKYWLKLALGLRNKINQTLSDKERTERELHFHNRQIQTTLDNIQSTVIIVNQQNRVILCNQAAMRLLNKGESFVGRKLDAVIHSSELTQILMQAHNGEAVPLKQLETMHLGKMMHLDVSAAPIHWIYDEFDHLVLVAMHDTTNLRQLERMRSEFVLNVSHELRTPVTVIKGFSEILAEDAENLGIEQIKDYLSRIYKSSQRLHYLVEDLLTLSRLENPNQHFLQLAPVDLGKLIDDFIGNYHYPFPGNSLPICFDKETDNSIVLADAIRLEQVLENLFNNANRYATGATQINVRLYKNTKHIFCEVKDDGCGISEKNVPLLFQRFFRVDKARSREDGGTGLGLSIVKNIIIQHKGNITADSEPGQGLKITFSIPKAN